VVSVQLAIAVVPFEIPTYDEHVVLIVGWMTKSQMAGLMTVRDQFGSAVVVINIL